MLAATMHLSLYHLQTSMTVADNHMWPFGKRPLALERGEVKLCLGPTQSWLYEVCVGGSCGSHRLLAV